MLVENTLQGAHGAAAVDAVSRSLAIVDLTLRDVFTDNYWKRCMYAAFGLQQSLKEEGIASDIVAGDVACFVLYTQDNQPGIDGFMNETPHVPAHFWVETGDSLIDLGPHYLPRDTKRPIANMPFIRWPLNQALPHYLRYRESARYGPGVKLQVEDAIMERMGHFLEQCESRRPSNVSPTNVTDWELRGTDSLRIAARQGDQWARGALKFQEWVDPRKLPF